MNINEFILTIKQNGAMRAPARDDRAIALASSALQNIRARVLPQFIVELYKETGGIILGNAYIFGTSELTMTGKFPVPTIVQINTDIAHIRAMRGKTIFARNDLFWFAFDAFGVCYMLDNLTLRAMRKYDDPYRAMLDCLAVGK